VTEEDPMEVEIVHRGRRRLVPVVLHPVVEHGPGELYVDGRHAGHVVSGLVVELRLPGGHEPPDRFIEEMAEDLGPALEEATDA
jgi:hypothetical protein